MRQILLTGMSGTGKSTVVAELAARGYRAIDCDTGGHQTVAPAAARAPQPGGGRPACTSGEAATG